MRRHKHGTMRHVMKYSISLLAKQAGAPHNWHIARVQAKRGKPAKRLIFKKVQFSDNPTCLERRLCRKFSSGKEVDRRSSRSVRFFLEGQGGGRRPTQKRCPNKPPGGQTVQQPTRVQEIFFLLSKQTCIARSQKSDRNEINEDVCALFFPLEFFQTLIHWILVDFEFILI